MMSVATAELSRSTQHLIDSRLDTIDRMLLGRVSRQERLEIVREVEAQIFEQLHERGAEAFSREHVLAVLARLDPPEAYLPEEGGESLAVLARPISRPPAGRVSPASRIGQRTGKASAIVGLAGLIAMLLGGPVVYGLTMWFRSEYVLVFLGGVTILLSLLAGFTAIGLSIYNRLASSWAIVGLTSGVLSMFASVGVPILVVAMIQA